MITIEQVMLPLYQALASVFVAIVLITSIFTYAYIEKEDGLKERVAIFLRYFCYSFSLSSIFIIYILLKAIRVALELI